MRGELLPLICGQRQRIEPAELARLLGCRIVLKCENLNPTGAFKVRGGVNLLAALEPSERARGVAAASTGNHGQSVAYAARLFGCQATIFMPEGANPLKVTATEALGANVVQIGRDFDAARLAAEEHAARHGMRFVHSSDEPLLVAGVGTATLELLEAAPDLHTIFVPLGGGSGVLGAGVVARAVNPAIRVVGVQAERRFGGLSIVARGTPGRYRERGNLCRGSRNARAVRDALGAFSSLVDEIMLVSDDQIAQSVRMLVKTTRQVTEGAGAAALAAAMTRRSELAGTNVGLILSGGNITIEQLTRILNHQPP